MTLPHLPFDPELGMVLAGSPSVPSLNAEVLAPVRPFSSVSIEAVLEGRGVDRREVSITDPVDDLPA